MSVILRPELPRLVEPLDADLAIAFAAVPDERRHGAYEILQGDHDVLGRFRLGEPALGFQLLKSSQSPVEDAGQLFEEFGR